MTSSFSNFREGFNFLRRRFSSNDLSNDSRDEPTTKTTTAADAPTSTTTDSVAKTPPVVESSAIVTAVTTVVSVAATPVTTSTASTKGPFPSAPSSPSRGTRPTSDGYSFARNLFGRNSQKSSLNTAQTKQHKFDPRRCKTLLVIDDSDVAWETYFKGKKIADDYDIRVEQAGFSSIHVTSCSERGATVKITSSRDVAAKSFKPDVVLVRQKVKDGHEDWSHVIVALRHGGVVSVNDLNSVYNFADKNWLFAQLVEIQRKLGKEEFPLIKQTYFSSCKDITDSPELPLVAKVGHSPRGIGVIKIEHSSQFQDWTEFLQPTRAQLCVQPLIEAKCDVRIQKIANQYRAFSRTPISSHWKISSGQVMLEEIPVTEKHKMWLEESSACLGDPDILSLQVLLTDDDKEYLIGAEDCTMSLMGESQEEDRKFVCQLLLNKMEDLLNKQTNSEKTICNDTDSTDHDKRPPLKSATSGSRDQVEDSEDTMRNLRKTFAGIFGDM